MTQANHPSKYLVRAPPPTPEEIRRQLGWGMLLFEQKISNGGRS